MKRISKAKIEFFQNKILDWFETEGRKFPWRKRKLSSYQKVIAEVLLQRTKAETVAKFYYSFLEKYPDWNSLNRTRIKTLEKVSNLQLPIKSLSRSLLYSYLKKKNTVKGTVKSKSHKI